MSDGAGRGVELPGNQFRWRFADDLIGEQWSDWHTVGDTCPACCCGGPHDGEHQQASEYYDEDGILTSGHTRLDPTDLDEWDTVEWRSASDHHDERS